MSQEIKNEVERLQAEIGELLEDDADAIDWAAISQLAAEIVAAVKPLVNQANP